MRKNKNTILIIICLFVILGNAFYSSHQREKYTNLILESNLKIKKSNDSVITVIKEFSR